MHTNKGKFFKLLARSAKPLPPDPAASEAARESSGDLSVVCVGLYVLGGMLSWAFTGMLLESEAGRTSSYRNPASRWGGRAALAVARVLLGLRARWR